MKAIAIVLICLAIPNAQAVLNPGTPVNLRPRITNWFNAVDVEIWNTTDKDVDCRGYINIRARSGRLQREYYWETIYRGFSNRRTYRLWDFNDSVLWTDHTIRCTER